MLVYLSAGEHSGDVHGATLAVALRARCPGVELLGMGGSLMRAAGVDILFDPTRESTIGFFEVVANLAGFRRILRKVVTILAERHPDVVVWVDFGGFNLVLAKDCRRLGIPVVCVFSPSAWAYGRKRASKMAARVTELAAVLPFEAEFYRSYGLKTTFVGHPVLDLVQLSHDPADFRTRMGVSEDEQILALLPGSRQQEVARLLPVMLAAATRLINDGRRLRLFLALAPPLDRTTIETIIARYGSTVDLVADQTYDLLAASSLAVIASGTATLEAAIVGTPFVSVYRVSPLSAAFYRFLRNQTARGKPISSALPNLIAGRHIVPELLQEDLSTAALATEAARILDDDAYRTTMMAALAEVKQHLGEPGAMGRVAEIVLRVAAQAATARGRVSDEQ